MPAVTGKLANFGLVPQSDFMPTIKWRPSGPAVTIGTDSFFLTSKPIITTPASDGSFTVNLVQTDILRPVAWYTPEIEMLDPGSEYTYFDPTGWRVFVPAQGGNITDLMATPWNPVLAWAGPEQPAGIPVANTLWYDSDSPMGDLSIWSN